MAIPNGRAVSAEHVTVGVSVDNDSSKGVMDAGKPSVVGLRRGDVRTLKRAMRAAGAPEASEQQSELGRASALALLDRSIQCRHERLAILRLIAAIELGAAVRSEQWKYCEEVVARGHNGALRDLLSRVVPAERTMGRNR
jgi:hypothetical protein